MVVLRHRPGPGGEAAAVPQLLRALGGLHPARRRSGDPRRGGPRQPGDYPGGLRVLRDAYVRRPQLPDVGGMTDIASAERPVKVLCWSERTEKEQIYPEGINGAIAKGLREHGGFDVRVANLQDDG